MKGLVELVRLGIYGFLIYQIYFVSGWVALAVGLIFLLGELMFFLLGYLKRQVDLLGFAQTQAINTDFGFSSEALTNEEAELVDRIREGDLVAAVSFLKGRCQNKLIDFGLLPEPLRLILAQRLINAINRNESPTWKELLSDNANEKSQSNEVMLLNRALRIAAVEAYHSEVLETEMYDNLIGADKEFPSIDSWIQDRINSWLHEAEIKPKNVRT